MRTMTARDVMHAEVLGVRADMTALEAAGFLTENQIAGAPVLDEHGHLVGVVSLTDLAENEEESGTVLVSEIMTPTVYTVPDDTPVPEIASTMIAGRIHRLFVTRKRRVVGIVTPLDLLRLLTGEEVKADPAAGVSVPAAIRPKAHHAVAVTGARKASRARNAAR
jgi:CBS domain-containing protein